ncbi:30S ribosomal protein S2 [Candidatus Microgenomates bacterium]|nr:30S ribosomal protein S2 [Candidatus Microgenomates bacterium]
MAKAKTSTKKAESAAVPQILEELLEVGAHFGHRADRWNPKIASYLFGIQDGIHIFDLEKTHTLLTTALAELKNRASLGQTILFVGTKPQAQEVIKKVSGMVGMPYIEKRWIGGLFTNWDHIKKSVEKLAKMKTEREAGEYKQFTKREQLLLDREISKLERIFGGIAGLTKLPDILVIVDVNREMTAVLEAKRLNVPIVAIVDSNADPNLVDFPIPANDDSIKAVEYIINKLGEAIAQGQKSEARSTKSENEN